MKFKSGMRIVFTRLESTKPKQKKSSAAEKTKDEDEATAEAAAEAEAKAEAAASEELAKLTLEADRYATTHLGAILFPLIVGFAVRTLVMDKHSSWYSWLITTLTSCV
jgi:hypothetical protein